MTTLFLPHIVKLPLNHIRVLGRQLPWAVLIFAFGGLFAAGVLSAGHLLVLPLPCGGSRGCADVANHPASKFFGVPIAFFGVAAYVLLLALLVRAARARWARIACVALAAAGTVVSGWLLYYSHTVIGGSCPWCIGSGVAMTLVFVVSAWLLWRGGPWPAPRPAVFWGLALMTSAGIGLAGGLMQRAANAPPIPAEKLADVKTDEFVDPAKSVGPADAPVTIVVFADLWCPACRNIHGSLIEHQKKNPAGVRLAFRHLPLKLSGHQQSGFAAALSEIAAEQHKFWPFVNTIYTHVFPLTREGYLEIFKDVGVNATDAEKRVANGSDPAAKKVFDDLALAERFGISATPTFIVFVKDHPPVSATAKILERILNSPEVLSRLAAVNSSPSPPAARP